MNIDKGIVNIDGKNYTACDGENIAYMKSLSTGWQTAIKVVSYAGSFVLGFVAGFLTANPLVGMAVGAAIGTAIGSFSAAVVCSCVYDVNFCRWSCALSLIVGSACWGATGGQIGGSIGQIVEILDAKAEFEAAVTQYNQDMAKYKGVDLVDAAANDPNVANDLIAFSQKKAATQLKFIDAYYKCFGTEPYSSFLIGHHVRYISGSSAEFLKNCIYTLTNMERDLAAAELISSVFVTVNIIASSIGSAFIVAGEINYEILIAPSLTYANHYDFNKTLSSDSKSFIVDSDLIHSIKIDKDGDIQVVNQFIDPDNSSFTAEEIIDAISSIDVNSRNVIDSILY
ncbi:hypothetical protein [uncultured Methanobrevibacter sp.]|uniref:hypothetical protein n=1 Tax=uncultured Methanobrevibacter sp. TaxID=253161 RepID=UPI0025E4ACF9|nr:hypothetical protein [uncultured Methanobrevibacter sp.]